MLKISKLNKDTILQLSSFACVIHCIVSPLLVMFLPLLGSFFHNIWLEILILSSSIGCGLYIIHNGYLKYKKKIPYIVFFIGLLFWISHILLEVFHIHGVELALMIIGSVFVITSFYFNHKYLHL
ncbi:MAG: hypothetical protein CMP39_04650 [Rickettsiales bacterium]|nr:hypothetical protein [Rickettsiales bacterium]